MQRGADDDKLLALCEKIAFTTIAIVRIIIFLHRVYNHNHVTL